MSEGKGQVYEQFKRLQDASQAREFMQALINAYDKNEVSKDKARTLGYLIKIFIDTVEKADLQQEFEELKEAVEKMQGNKKGRWSA